MANRFWVGGSGNWSDNTNHWSDSSGGSPGVAVPTSSDDVYIDVNSFTGNSQTILIDSSYTAYAKSLTISGVTNSSCALKFNSSANLDLYGNLTVSVTNFRIDYYSGYGQNINVLAPATIDVAACGTKHLRVNYNITMPNDTDVVQLGSNYYNYANNFIIYKGTFTTNNYDFTPGNFYANHATNNITVNLGSSNVYSRGANYTDWWNVGSGSNITINSGTSTIINSNNSTRNFNGGGKTYYNIIPFTLTDTACTYVIKGNNTFNSIYTNITTNYNNVLSIEAGSTQIITGDFDLQHSGSGTLTLNSSSSGTQGTLSKSSGTVSVDNLTIKDSVVTGGADWYAGSSSVDDGNNSGWVFTDPPAAIGIKSVNGLTKSSVKSFNGLANASIKSIDGLS